MKNTITIEELKAQGCATYTVRDESVRGCHAASVGELKVGDEVCVNNEWCEIVADDMPKTIDGIVEAIEKYFDENDDVLTECAEELDDYDGYIGDDRYYSMDELPELLSEKDMIDVLNMAFNGYDLSSWDVDERGERVYRYSFNPNRNYFRFNAYWNLVSSDWRDYSDFNDRYFAERLHECRDEICAIDDDETLCALFDKWDELEAAEA